MLKGIQVLLVCIGGLIAFYAAQILASLVAVFLFLLVLLNRKAIVNTLDECYDEAKAQTQKKE